MSRGINLPGMFKVKGKRDPKIDDKLFDEIGRVTVSNVRKGVNMVIDTEDGAHSGEKEYMCVTILVTILWFIKLRMYVIDNGKTKNLTNDPAKATYTKSIVMLFKNCSFYTRNWWFIKSEAKVETEKTIIKVSAHGHS